MGRWKVEVYVRVQKTKINICFFFGAELKRAGYDAVIFTGKSEKLVYVWIDDDSIQLMGAQHLKGKSLHETEIVIKKT